MQHGQPDIYNIQNILKHTQDQIISSLSLNNTFLTIDAVLCENALIMSFEYVKCVFVLIHYF